MSKRSAVWWRNRIADYESTNPRAEIWTEQDHDGYLNGPLYYVVVLDGSGQRYALYTVDQCRAWCSDRY